MNQANGYFLDILKHQECHSERKTWFLVSDYLKHIQRKWK